MQKKKDYLKNIFKALLYERDLNNLSLDESNDDLSNLCRAYILQFFYKNQNYKQSLSFINAKKNELTFKLLNTFFDINGEKNFDSFEASSKKHMWDSFCPEALKSFESPENLKKKLLERRKLKNIEPSKILLKNPALEILFTSNVLITIPSEFSSKNIPEEINTNLLKFKNVKQSFWYDHPIPLDSLKRENEIIYGLKNLDDALDIEVQRNNINKLDKITLILSVSVTHEGLEDIALKYIKLIIKKYLKLKHIYVFLFDEDTCNKITSNIFSTKDPTHNNLGVNGNYGRHYTFLKYILLLWNRFVDPNFKYSFKIDLDQIFDQGALLRNTGFSIFEIFKNQKNWGGSAFDYQGNKVDLGLLAGALVNKNDISDGLFTPDVKRPNNNDLISQFSSKKIFCPEWPQSLSTETELMYQSNDIQRIHVTGGTTGITLDCIKKWAPFTPSFINRAEDQAFGISSIQENEYLSHIHGKNLIMRHDKQAFATKSIEISKYGKEIGNLERILLFSYYAQEHELGYNKLKEKLWPFTSCFLTKDPELLTGLIFLIDGCFNGNDYVSKGTKRLMDTHIFCKTKLNKQLINEKNFWKELVERLKQYKDYNNNLKKVLTSNKI